MQLYLGTYLSEGSAVGDADLWKDLQALGYVPTFAKIKANNQKNMNEKGSATSNASLTSSSWFHDPPEGGEPEGSYPCPTGLRLERYTDVNGVMFYVAGEGESAARIATKLGVDGGAARLIEANRAFLDGLHENCTFRLSELLRVPVAGVTYSEPDSLEVPQPAPEILAKLMLAAKKKKEKMGGVSAKSEADFRAGRALQKIVVPRSPKRVKDADKKRVVISLDSDSSKVDVSKKTGKNGTNMATTLGEGFLGESNKPQTAEDRAAYEQSLISANRLFLTSAQRAERALILKARKKQELEAAEEKKRAAELASQKKNAEKRKAAEEEKAAKAKAKQEKKDKKEREKREKKEKRDKEKEAKKKAKKDSLATIGNKRKKAAKVQAKSRVPLLVQAGSAELAHPSSGSSPSPSLSSSSPLPPPSTSVPSPERKKKKKAPPVPTSPAAYRKWLMTSNPFFLSAKQKEERTRNLQKDRAQRSLKAEIAQRRKETSALFGCNTPEGAKARGKNGKFDSRKKGRGKSADALPYQQKKKSVAAIFSRAAGGASGKDASSVTFKTGDKNGRVVISLGDDGKTWTVRSALDGNIMDVFEPSELSLPPWSAWTLPPFPLHASAGDTRLAETQTRISWPPLRQTQEAHSSDSKGADHSDSRTSFTSTPAVMRLLSDKLVASSSSSSSSSPSLLSSSATGIIDLSLDSAKKNSKKRKAMVCLDCDDSITCQGRMVLSLSKSTVRHFVYKNPKSSEILKFALHEYNALVEAEQNFSEMQRDKATASNLAGPADGNSSKMTAQAVRELFAYIMERRFVMTSSHSALTTQVNPAEFSSKVAAAASVASASARLPPLKSAVDMTWTDKYRPLTTAQLCGNDQPRSKLRNWLSEWTPEAAAAAVAEAARLATSMKTGMSDFNDDEESASFSSRKRKGRKGRRDVSSKSKRTYGSRRRSAYQVFEDSDGDYSSSEDSDESNGRPALVNVMCIVGPTGCGKTAAVYACAAELCYNVLEVNAGDTAGRGRKQILSQFGEATTSHRLAVPIKKKNSVLDLSGEIKNKVGKKASRTKAKRKRNGDTTGEAHTKSKKGAQKKPRSSQNGKAAPSTTSGQRNGAKNTLILFEEVDLIPMFDDRGYDAGFFSAVKQLAATSKRPIVLTATTLTHGLQKALDVLHAGYAHSSSNVLHFSAPSVPRIVLHSRLICAAESGGQQVRESEAEILQNPSTKDLVTLARASGRDIRSILNSLQLWSQCPLPLVASQEEIVTMAMNNVENELQATTSLPEKKTRRKGRASARKKKTVPPKKNAPASKRTSKRRAAAAAASVAESLPDQMLSVASLSGVAIPSKIDETSEQSTNLISRWSGRMLGIDHVALVEDGKKGCSGMHTLRRFLESNAVRQRAGGTGGVNLSWSSKLSLPFAFEIALKEALNSCCDSNDGDRSGDTVALPTWMSRHVPVVHSITPSSGVTAGGTEVTVHGKNFLSRDMATERASIEVRIGGLICPRVVVISDKVLRVTTPVRLCSMQEARHDREFNAWKAWFLAPRTVSSEPGKINFKRRARLQKRFKWVPPGVLEVRVVRAKGERQYSSLHHAPSFEVAACNQPLFEWVVEEDEENCDETAQSEESDRNYFESSDDDDDMHNEVAEMKEKKNTRSVVTKSFDESLLSHLTCQARQLSFWGESGKGKRMMRITGFTATCAQWLKDVDGIVGARVLTVNGETVIGHDFDELSQMLNDASTPAVIELETVVEGAAEEHVDEEENEDTGMKKVAQKGRGREGQEDRGEEVQEGNDNEWSNNGNKKQQIAPSPLAIEDGPEGTYSVTYQCKRLGLRLADGVGKRGLYVLSIDPAGPSADTTISRGDIVLTVAGHSVIDDCTPSEACDMILNNERPLCMTFLQKKFAKAKFQAMKDAEKAKKEAERIAKLRLIQAAHDDQKAIQNGVARPVVDIEMDLSLVSSTVDELGGDPLPSAQRRSSCNNVKASQNAKAQMVSAAGTMEALCRLSSDLSFCDVMETAASRGFTKSNTGAQRAAPRMRWQHALWAHDSDTTNASCKGGHALIGSTWSDALDPLAGCTIGGTGKYGGGGGAYDYFDSSLASVQSSAVHDRLQERFADLSATMQNLAVRTFEQIPRTSLLVEPFKNGRLAMPMSSMAGTMPRYFLEQSMRRRAQFSLYARLVRAVASTRLVGFLGPHGLREGSKLRGGKHASSFSGAPGATCTAGGCAVNDVVGFLRAIAMLEAVRKEESVSRRWTHEFDRTGLAVSHEDRDKLALIGTRFAFPPSSLSQSKDAESYSSVQFDETEMSDS